MPENPWREGIMERAVYTFLEENEGSRVHSRGQFSAVIMTGGLTPEQLADHRRMVRWTLGLWWIVFAAVALANAPRAWSIRVDGQGNVEVRSIA